MSFPSFIQKMSFWSQIYVLRRHQCSSALFISEDVAFLEFGCYGRLLIVRTNTCWDLDYLLVA